MEERAVKPVVLVEEPPLAVAPQFVTLPLDFSAAKALSVAAMLMKWPPPGNAMSPAVVVPQVAMVPSARSAAKALGFEWMAR